MHELHKKLHKVFLRACVIAERSLLEPKNFILTFTFWSDRRTTYAWGLTNEMTIELAVANPSGFLGKSYERPAARFSLRPTNIPVLTVALAELEKTFIPLRADPVDRLGESACFLIRFSRIHRYLVLNSHDLDHYAPRQFAEQLVRFVDAVETHNLPFLTSLLRVSDSVIARIPVDHLQTYLDKEKDSVIAFLLARIPADNIKQYVESLGENRKVNIQSLAQSQNGEDPDRDWAFREIERQLERKYAEGRRPSHNSR